MSVYSQTANKARPAGLFALEWRDMVYTPPTFLTYALGFTARAKYPLIFVGALVEGPVLMIAAGFFYRYGVFSLAPLFIALVAGDLVGDIAWYWAGYYFAEPLIRKHGQFIGVTPEIFGKVKGLFADYHEKILFISKITLGFGMAIGVLMTAGATRVPFRKYLVLNLLGEFVFVSALLTIGYFFGDIYTHITPRLKFAFAAVVSVALISLIYGASSYLRKKTLTV